VENLRNQAVSPTLRRRHSAALWAGLHVAVKAERLMFVYSPTVEYLGSAVVSLSVDFSVQTIRRSTTAVLNVAVALKSVETCTTQLDQKMAVDLQYLIWKQVRLPTEITDLGNFAPQTARVQCSNQV